MGRRWQGRHASALRRAPGPPPRPPTPRLERTPLPLLMPERLSACFHQKLFIWGGVAPPRVTHQHFTGVLQTGTRGQRDLPWVTGGWAPGMATGHHHRHRVHRTGLRRGRCGTGPGGRGALPHATDWGLVGDVGHGSAGCVCGCRAWRGHAHDAGVLPLATDGAGARAGPCHVHGARPQQEAGLVPTHFRQECLVVVLGEGRVG